MARLPKLTCGWETGDASEVASPVTTLTGTVTAVTSSPTPYSGTYCLKALPGSSPASVATVTVNFGSNQTELWFRLRVFPNVGTVSTNSFGILKVWDSAGAVQVSLSASWADGLIRAYRGNAGGTLLGTASAQLNFNAWNLIEIHLKIDPSVGIVEVWVNNIQRLNLTGQNTRSTALTNMLTATFGTNALGDAGITFSATSFLAFDDFAVNDLTGSANNGRPGDSRILYLVPTGPGANTNQSRGGTDSGANWSQVDEIPPDSGSTYVYSSTYPTRDTYALSDLPVTATSVNCVEVIAQCANSDAGAGSIGLTTVTNGGATVTEAAAQALNTTFGYYRALLETDPSTGLAWTVSAVNAMEAGTTTEP